jgi:hypothetical protein
MTGADDTITAIVFSVVQGFVGCLNEGNTAAAASGRHGGAANTDGDNAVLVAGMPVTMRLDAGADAFGQDGSAGLVGFRQYDGELLSTESCDEIRGGANAL